MRRLPYGHSDSVANGLGEDKARRVEMFMGARDDQFGQSENQESSGRCQFGGPFDEGEGFCISLRC